MYQEKGDRLLFCLKEKNKKKGCIKKNSLSPFFNVVTFNKKSSLSPFFYDPNGVDPDSDKTLDF